MANINNQLLQRFLKERALIDRDSLSEPTKKKDEPNVMEKPSERCEDSVRMIIETKPSKKKVMEFLKRKIAQYTDATSSDDD